MTCRSKISLILFGGRICFWVFILVYICRTYYSYTSSRSCSRISFRVSFRKLARTSPLTLRWPPLGRECPPKLVESSSHDTSALQFMVISLDGQFFGASSCLWGLLISLSHFASQLDRPYHLVRIYLFLSLLLLIVNYHFKHDNMIAHNTLPLRVKSHLHPEPFQKSPIQSHHFRQGPMS